MALPPSCRHEIKNGGTNGASRLLLWWLARALKQGLSMQPKWGEYQNNYIRKYYVTHGRGFCAGALGFSPNTVSSRALALGLREASVNTPQQPRDLRVERLKPEAVWPSITRCKGVVA